MPFFSVVIPVFNKAPFVKKTLQSVYAQEFTDFEVIVVNDGSTDKSFKKIKEIDDNRQIIVSIENSGVSAARNFGVTKANGNHIVFLDGDDLWEPNHLSILKELIQDFPDCGMYCTGYHKKKSEKTNVRAQFGTIADGFKGLVHNYFENSLPFTVAGMGAVAVPRHIFEETGGFSEDVSHGEDIELWSQLAITYPVALHNIPTVLHQLHVSQRSSTVSLRKKRFPDFSRFEAEETSNKALKFYLDNNRYAIALSYRLEKDYKRFKYWKSHINLKNLNKKQKLLFKLPVGVVATLQKAHQFLLEKGIYISTFR